MFDDIMKKFLVIISIINSFKATHSLKKKSVISRYMDMTKENKDRHLIFQNNEKNNIQSQFSLSFMNPPNKYHNYCMDITAGLDAIMWPCHGGDNQKFYLDGDTKQLTTPSHPGYCLDLNVATNNVNMYQCHDGLNQKWVLEGSVIKSAYSANLCLESNTDKSNTMVVAECDGSKWNQNFVETAIGGDKNVSTASNNVSTATAIDLSQVSISFLNPPNKYSNYCMGIIAAGLDATMLPCDGGGNQEFYFDGDTKQLTTPSHPGYCLDLNVATNNVNMYQCHDGLNQKWSLEGSAIKSGYSKNLCLESNTDKSNTMIVDECDGSKWNQKFVEKGITSSESGSAGGDKNIDNNVPTSSPINLSQFSISFLNAPKKYNNYCMDITSDLDAIMWPCHGGDNQEFYLDGDTQQLKTPSHPGYCLDLNVATNNVNMYPCHDGVNQKWFLDGSTIKCAYSANLCLESNTDKSNTMIVADCDGSKWNQKFLETGITTSDSGSAAITGAGTRTVSVPNLTDQPSISPTVTIAKPTAGPTASPTNISSSNPSSSPTASPTNKSSSKPSSSPTASPTNKSSSKPSSSPTASPTNISSSNPTSSPTTSPTNISSSNPSSNPTASPSKISTSNPTSSPIIVSPTGNPTASPTASPQRLKLSTIPPSHGSTVHSRSSEALKSTMLPTSLPVKNPGIHLRINTLSPTDSPENSSKFLGIGWEWLSAIFFIVVSLCICCGFCLLIYPDMVAGTLGEMMPLL